jgi:hypothetical protein
VPQIVKMALRWTLAGLAVAAAAPASAMPVSAFLAKMDKLTSEGPMATATSDAALIKKELQDDAAALRSERLAATQAGKTPPYCRGEGSAQPTLQEIVAGLKTVPVAKRGTTEVKDALRSFMAKRFPCTR